MALEDNLTEKKIEELRQKLKDDEIKTRVRILDSAKMFMMGWGLNSVLPLEKLNVLYQEMGLAKDYVQTDSLNFHSSMCAVAGVFAGVTNRRWAPNIFYFVSLLPNIYDAHKGEDPTQSFKQVALKTGIIYSGWTLGKLGKYIYDLNTNKDGVDLF